MDSLFIFCLRVFSKIMAMPQEMDKNKNHRKRKLLKSVPNLKCKKNEIVW